MTLQVPAFILHALAAMCPSRNDDRHYGFIGICRDMVVGGQGAAIMAIKLSREVAGFDEGCYCFRFRGITAEGFRLLRRCTDRSDMVVLDTVTLKAWKYGHNDQSVEFAQGGRNDSGFERAVKAMIDVDQEVAAPLHGLNGIDVQFLGRAFHAIRRLKDPESCEGYDTAAVSLSNTPRRSKALWCFAVSPANISKTYVDAVRLIVGPLRLGEPQDSRAAAQPQPQEDSREGYSRKVRTGRPYNSREAAHSR